jgi:integrase
MRGILKRGDDYYIDYRVNGRRKRCKIGPSKKLAETVLRKRKVEAAENKHLDIRRDQKIKFKELAHQYIETHAKPNKRSWATTDKHYMKQLAPAFGDKCLHEITPMLIEKYKAARSREVSHAYVNRELACLKCMFHKAIDWGMTKENPARKVKLFKENNQRMRYLEREEIERLLKNCSPHLKPIVLIALNTGMRKAEIQNLKWSDINLQRGYLTIRESKSGESRHLPMNKTVRDTILSIRKHPETSYVLGGKDGLPYNFRKAFETCLKKSGILGFRFHDLRHTFASHLVMSGVDLNTVRELLGHKSLSMTLRYSHLSRDHKSRAVESLEGKMDTFWTLERTESEPEKLADSLSYLNLVS